MSTPRFNKQKDEFLEMSAPRFNKQKDEFLEMINELTNEGNNLLTQLQEKKPIKDLGPQIIKFSTGVNNLVSDFNERKEFFAKLAFSISSTLDGNVSEEVWRSESEKKHDEGIFQWMHSIILKLLEDRWKKLNLSNNGPTAPPNYKNATFNNYKDIINAQNRIKSEINDKRTGYMNNMAKSMKALSQVTNKVTPSKAN